MVLVFYLFAASNTGKFLKSSGATQYGQNAWSTVNVYKDKGLAYLEASSPEYYKAAVELGGKYSKLAGDLYIITRNLSVKLYSNVASFIGEKKPLVAEGVSLLFLF